MRRTVLLLASTALAVLVVGGAALAATIGCPNRTGNVCIGTAQADTMNGRDLAADDVRGLGGADSLRTRGANDKLTGGLGTDTLNGALGSDTYLFDDGWGQDGIGSEGGGVDTLDFSALSADVRVDLVATAGAPEADAGTNTLNVANTATVIENVRGGAKGDNIGGNSANNTFFGNGGGDGLWGGSGQDALFGGAEGDAFQGEGGDDTLAGGGGSDSYRYFDFQGAFGEDTITDSPIPSDTSIYTGNEVSFSGFTDALTINLVADPSRPEVTTRLGNINWSGNVIDNVNNQSYGNDTVIGNSAANYIVSVFGNDKVYAGGGDDTIHVQDRVGADEGANDEVDCGPGNDTVHWDSADLINFVDCENTG